MRMRCALLLPLFLAACGGHHPLAGNWEQVTADGKDGIDLEFEIGGSRVKVHTAPRPDGTHDHVDGTYTFDAGAHKLTVDAELLGVGKAKAWAGTVDGDKLELSSADGKLAFRHADGPHHH